MSAALREAAQQALEALEALDAPPSGVVDHYELDRRKQALKAALEQPVQPEQEPELRELLIGAAAMAVAAERKGEYQGASWVADAVLEQQEKQRIKPEQDPVAWMLPRTDSIITAATKVYRGVWAENYTQRLYTAPPCREWHSLTDKEIRRMGIETPGQQGGWNLAFARAVEAALKEKNA